MSLKIWLPLDGDLKNLGYSNVEAVNNGATINNSGKIGKCYHFGTENSYITLPKEVMTSMTTECSVAFWLKINTWNTSYATFFQAGLGSTPWGNYIFGFLRRADHNNCCFTISNGSSASNSNYSTSDLEEDTWYHIALTYMPGKCKIYINGNLDNEYSTSIIPAFSSITNITLGKNNNGTNYQTNCDMNDIRIYDHCLSATEVKEISQGLILHYKLDNSEAIKDNSGYGRNGTITGTLITSNNSAHYNASTYISDGLTSYITTPSLSFDSKAITLNIWVKSTNTSPTGNYHTIINSSANSNWYQILIYKNGFIRLGLNVNGTRYINSNSTIQQSCLDGNWHMLTLTYDGNIIKRYIDGVMKNSTDVVATTGLSSPTALIIGKFTSDSYAAKEVNLSDFRIYCTALTEADIQLLYNTSMRIDDLGGIHAYELNENTSEETVTEGPSNIITINDASAASVNNLLVNIEPVQSGSGDPSPDNVRPISGWTGCNVIRTGKNLLKYPYFNVSNTVNGITFTVNDDKSITIDGTATANADFYLFKSEEPLPLPNGSYLFSSTYNGQIPDNGFYIHAKANQDDSSYLNISIGSEGSYTITNGVFYTACIRVLSGRTINNVTVYPIIRLASETNNAFEPYQGTTYHVTFPTEAGTVYGGTLNMLTGELAVDKVGMIFDGTETWTALGQVENGTRLFRYTDSRGIRGSSSERACSHFANASILTSTTSIGYLCYTGAGSSSTRVQFRPGIDGITDTTTWKTWLAEQYAAGTPVTCWWDIATPITYQLSPQNIKLLSGNNTIWADTGDITLTYYKNALIRLFKNGIIQADYFKENLKSSFYKNGIIETSTFIEI